jgi:7-carboxy-7-deazaguanine synthase (Cx14CxxC type)
LKYAVKEICYTLQGEGANSGKPSVFCRFAGCNLWSGREADRFSATCRHCDTDFLGTGGPGGGLFSSAGDLAGKVAAQWPGRTVARPTVVCTGGEPLLQLDRELVAAFHAAGLAVAIETNGTLPAPPGIDWICVSPKAGAALALTRGDELKFVYPQDGAQPESFEGLEFAHFFLQPLDGPDLDENTRLAVRYCLDHPKWRLSLQIHKLLGIR